MSFTDRLDDVAPCDPNDYVRFTVDGHTVGLMTAAFAATLADYPETFHVSADRVVLAPDLRTPDERTRAVGQVLAALREKGLIPGWRNELYAVATDLHAQSLFHMERAATVLFGVRTYAICLNGYVRRDDGLHLWIARRAMTKETYPGELDLMVGGGHPAGLTLRKNLIKECQEEAGVDSAMAETAVPVSGISFCFEQSGDVINQFQFIYDLEVPADFTPRNTDGEVAAFYLWPVEKIMAMVRDTDEFMFDSALVIIDFLIRHGVIDSDHPDYSALVIGLRRPSPL